VVLKPLELVFKGSSRMGDSGGNSEDQSADRKVDNQDCGENWFSIGDLCYILMKSLSTFC
jgi:hypothetical protein